jgi:hypothetical protein
MSFMDRLFGKWGVCPECRTWGAWFLYGNIKCRIAGCIHYNPDLAQEPAPPQPISKMREFRGEFNPANRVSFRYRNHAGQENEYSGDADSVRVKGVHVSIRLLPTGRRAAFQQKYLLGSTIPALSKGAAPENAKPSPKEAQILGYYRLRDDGTMSANLPNRYMELKKKYPSC